MAARPSSAEGNGSAERPGALRWPLPVAVAVGALLTFAAAAPFVDVGFAFRNPPLHIALETAEALIACLVALVLFGRYRETRELRDLALVFALDLLALTIIVFSVTPSVVLQSRPEIVYAWAPATIRIVAAGLMVAAAFRLRSTAPVRRPALSTVAAAAAVVQLVGGVVISLAASLPQPLDPTLRAEEISGLEFHGHWGFLTLQATNMLLLGAAAFGFSRRAAREGDELLHWLGAACALGAFARMNYLLFPSLYTDYVYVGDILRLAFYILLLVGGVREIQSFWASRTVAAVANERRRFARDLHDGAAQELLFILAQTRRMLKGKGGREDLEALASAADRAVFESRRAINALSNLDEQSLASAVREAADELGKKWGRPIDLELEDLTVGADMTEQLVRVAREAVTNAVKHASPSSIVVRITGHADVDGEAIRLIVEDDGVGFDPAARASTGTRFGMTSMQERVKVMDGTLNVRSAPNEGTTVEVSVPVPNREA